MLTAQALARNSDIFKAGVDLAGVHLWGSSLDPDAVSFKSSAIGAIDRWKSPVLLVHGDDDRNVSFQQTTGLVQLLRQRDVYYELIVFPDDTHESMLHSRWMYTLERMEQFLRKFLGPERKVITDAGRRDSGGDGDTGGRIARSSNTEQRSNGDGFVLNKLICSPFLRSLRANPR